MDESDRIMIHQNHMTIWWRCWWLIGTPLYWSKSMLPGPVNICGPSVVGPTAVGLMLSDAQVQVIGEQVKLRKARIHIFPPSIPQHWTFNFRTDCYDKVYWWVISWIFLMDDEISDDSAVEFIDMPSLRYVASFPRSRRTGCLYDKASILAIFVFDQGFSFRFFSIIIWQSVDQYRRRGNSYIPTALVSLLSYWLFLQLGCCYYFFSFFVSVPSIGSFPTPARRCSLDPLANIPISKSSWVDSPRRLLLLILLGIVSTWVLADRGLLGTEYEYGGYSPTCPCPVL